MTPALNQLVDRSNDRAKLGKDVLNLVDVDGSPSIATAVTLVRQQVA